jgi:chromosome segregation ATPase
MVWKLSDGRGGKMVEHHVAWHQEQRRDQMANSDSPVSKILRFLHAPRRSTKGDGETALDLVFQAGEISRGTEDRANALEKRARSLTQSAIEKLKQAKNRIQELENKQQLIEERMSKVTVRMQEAVKALKWANSRIAAAEDRVIQAELRAGAAETRASMEVTVRRIEVAILTHLLRKRPEAPRKFTAAA